MKKGINLYDYIDPKVDITLIRSVKVPTRANTNDAGADWYIPDGHDDFREDLIKANEGRDLILTDAEDGQFTIIIPPHERIKIPSGLRVNIHDKDTYLAIDNKSGILNGTGLIFTADVIDADYRGECNICVVNTSNDNVWIQTGQKLVQVIQRIKINTEYNQISLEEFENLEETDRGTGGFGSSGLK
jgi:dUTP pyrophosphatase